MVGLATKDMPLARYANVARKPVSTLVVRKSYFVKLHTAPSQRECHEQPRTDFQT